jgi:predicted nucleic acid-binding Zn ribbon protein
METVAALLYGIFRGTPQHSDWIVACLQGAWPGLVGERLAVVCRPAALADGRLKIEILDADWAVALRSMDKELLAKLQAATGGEVTRISFS